MRPRVSAAHQAVLHRIVMDVIHVPESTGKMPVPPADFGLHAATTAAGGTDGVPLLLNSAMSKGLRRALLESSGTHQILNPER